MERAIAAQGISRRATGREGGAIGRFACTTMGEVCEARAAFRTLGEIAANSPGTFAGTSATTSARAAGLIAAIPDAAPRTGKFGTGTTTRIAGQSKINAGIARAASKSPFQTKSLARTFFVRNATSETAARPPSASDRAAASAMAVRKLVLA